MSGKIRRKTLNQQSAHSWLHINSSTPFSNSFQLLCQPHILSLTTTKSDVFQPDLSFSDVITGSTDIVMERPNSRLHCHPETHTYKCTVQPYFPLHTHATTVYGNVTKHRPSLGSECFMRKVYKVLTICLQRIHGFDT